ASNSATTFLNGSIVNKGTIQLNGGAGGNGILQISGNTTLSGGGTVFLDAASASGSAVLRGSNLPLTNNANLIPGAGFLGDSGALSVVNKATIDADAPGQTVLAVNQGNGGVTNTGLLEATNGGTLHLFNTIANAGGNITASGGTVSVDAT